MLLLQITRKMTIIVADVVVVVVDKSLPRPPFESVRQSGRYTKALSCHRKAAARCLGWVSEMRKRTSICFYCLVCSFKEKHFSTIYVAISSQSYQGKRQIAAVCNDLPRGCGGCERQQFPRGPETLQNRFPLIFYDYCWTLFINNEIGKGFSCAQWRNTIHNTQLSTYSAIIHR